MYPLVSLAERVKRRIVRKLPEWRPSPVHPSALHHPETAVDTSRERRVSRGWSCLGEYGNWPSGSAEIRDGADLA